MKIKAQLSYSSGMHPNCRNGFKRGHPVSEKLKNHLRTVNIGKHHSPQTEFKKGDKRLVGQNHFAWKGQGVSYSGLHHWLKRELGSPDTCRYCGKIGLKGKLITWANISHKYIRDVSDWIRLCQSCHKKYDLNKIQL